MIHLRCQDCLLGEECAQCTADVWISEGTTALGGTLNQQTLSSLPILESMIV